MKSICVEYTVHEDFNRWYQCIDVSLEATTNSKMRSYTMPELVAMEQLGHKMCVAECACSAVVGEFNC